MDFVCREDIEVKPPYELKEEARRVPNGWVYEIDPRWDADGEVPFEGIVRAWKVDDSGNVTGEVWENPRYARPD